MTTDNTQELDDLLQRFAMSEQQIGDELAVGAIQEETFDVRDTLAREEAKEAILDWHNKQVEAVLDRLEARLTEEASGIRQIKTDYAHGFTAANDQTNEAIEAERNKLKESSDE